MGHDDRGDRGERSGTGSRAGGTLDPGRWVDAHGNVLYRYALSRLRDPDAAEEVVQETFVAALEAREQYSGAGTEAGWLMGILKRKIVDLVRRRNRADSAAGGDSQPDPVELLFDSKGNWRVDPRLARGRPEAALEREEFWGAFRACLDHLPQRQADVFTLRELEEVESEGICEALGISTSNLWVLLHRARLRLIHCLKIRLEKEGA
jgi:RNA polymerase sigma-70 factor (TIGR02943 family)